jgi:hypothetical protein
MNERVVSLYILYNLYNIVPIHQNPFLILFLNLYKTLSSNLAFVKTNYDLLVEFRVEALILADKGSQVFLLSISPKRVKSFCILSYLSTIQQSKIQSN